MDEILKLQEQLAAVQARKTTAVLSDRLAVDLVAKLQELAFVPPSAGLIASETGKEFVTAAALRSELRALLRAKGGRVSIVEAASTMNVYLGACEKAADELVSSSESESESQFTSESASASSPSPIRLIAGDLVSSDFFDNIAREAAELLSEGEGHITIAALAERFNLPAAIVDVEVRRRIGDMKAKMEQGLIYTETYLNRLRARLRGALRALTTPTSISSIESILFRDQDKSARPKVSLKAMAQEMIENVESTPIAGSISSSTFIPSLFSTAQDEVLAQFFSQNQYVTEEMAQRVGITRPTAYLQRTFPNSVRLESIWVSEEVCDTLAEAVDEALAQYGWCDSHPFLPSFLSAGDIEKLLDRFVEANNATKKKSDSKKAATAAAAAAAAATEVMVLSSTFLVLVSFVDNSAQSLQDWAVNRGKEVATLRKSNPKTKPVATDEKDDKPNSKKKNANSNNDEVDDDDDDKDKDKKKRRSAKKKKSSNPVEAKGGRAESSTSKGGARGGDEDGLKVDDIAQQICSLHSSLDTKLARALASQIHTRLLPPFVQGLNSVFSAGNDERKRLNDKWGKDLVEWHFQLSLISNGIKVLQGNTDWEKTYHRHVIRKVGVKCIDRLVRLQDDNGTLHDLPPEDYFSEAFISQSWDRISAAIGRPAATRLSPLREAVLGSSSHSKSSSGPAIQSSTEFCQAVEDEARDLGHRLKPVDKKAERSAVFTQKKSLSEELSRESSPIGCLGLFISLLAIKEFGVLVMLPGKLFLPAIRAINEKMAAENDDGGELIKRLIAFHEHIVSDLASGSGEQPGQGGEASSPDLADETAALKASVLEYTGAKKP